MKAKQSADEAGFPIELLERQHAKNGRGIRKEVLDVVFKITFRKPLPDELLNQLIAEHRLIAVKITRAHGGPTGEILSSVPDADIPDSGNPMLYLSEHLPRWCMKKRGYGLVADVFRKKCASR